MPRAILKGKILLSLHKKSDTLRSKKTEQNVHPDEIEAITREFAAIGNNLNQIAMFFNSGGIQSRAMLETINHAIACIFEMREQVAEMAGKNYGNLKAYRK